MERQPAVKKADTSQPLQPARHPAQLAGQESPSLQLLLQLQSTIGNQAMQKLLRSGAIQAKLKIGQPGDVYEQEADRMAERVMRMPEPMPIGLASSPIQRKCAECGEEEKEKIRAKPASPAQAVGELDAAVAQCVAAPGGTLSGLGKGALNFLTTAERELERAAGHAVSGSRALVGQRLERPLLQRMVTRSARIDPDLYELVLTVDTTYTLEDFESDLDDGLASHMEPIDQAEATGRPEFQRTMQQFYEAAFGTCELGPGESGRMRVRVRLAGEEGERIASLETSEGHRPIEPLSPFEATQLRPGEEAETPEAAWRGTASPPESYPQVETRARQEVFQPTDPRREEALRELEEGGLLVGASPLAYESWNPRPRTARARAAAPAEVAALTQEQRGLQQEEAQVQAAIEALPDRQRDRSPVQQRDYQRLLSRRGQIRSRLVEIERDLGRSEPLLSEHPPERVAGNRAAVQVDLTRTNIDICWARGSRQPSTEWRIDPVFAVAMIRFLRDIYSFGVTRMYSQGFLRPPATALDTHSQGLACDIAGFQVNGVDIHLRSGMPGPDDAMDLATGHSDFFDETDHLARTTRTHAAAMRQMVEIMRRHFGQIVGPGANSEHMAHFHVQLVGYRGSAGAVMAPGTLENPTPYTHPARGRP